jgi:hypothetical protein
VNVGLVEIADEGEAVVKGQGRVFSEMVRVQGKAFWSEKLKRNTHCVISLIETFSTGKKK